MIRAGTYKIGSTTVEIQDIVPSQRQVIVVGADRVEFDADGYEIRVAPEASAEQPDEDSDGPLTRKTIFGARTK